LSARGDLHIRNIPHVGTTSAQFVLQHSGGSGGTLLADQRFSAGIFDDDRDAGSPDRLIDATGIVRQITNGGTT
jgi:hypothetical protein